MKTGKGRKAAAQAQRLKRRNFTEEVYGARLPFEDARVLDDYARANDLDRSEVVRLGLHQFALRQQMRYHKKDPLRESLEQVVAEQITPVRRGTEEVMTLLNDIANFVVGQSRGGSPHPAARDAGEAASTQNDGTLKSPVEQALATQKVLVERTLTAVTLGLRLLVDYFIDPILRAEEMSAGDESAKRLEAAIRGSELWSRTTHKVVTRAGKRMLFESKLMTKEEWERLLAEYRAEDREEGMK